MTSEGLLFTSLCGTGAADSPRRFALISRLSASPTLVGYNSMETVEADLKWAVGTFENVAGTTEGIPTFKLSQIAIGEGEFAYYNLDYVATINQYGAQDKYYSWDPFSAEGGSWIETDEFGTPGEPANDVELPINEGLIFRSQYGTPLVFAGSVLGGDTEIYGIAEDVTYTGNFTPATITLGDLVLGEGEFAYYNLDYIATVNEYGAQMDYYSWDPFSADGGCWITTDEFGTPGDPANETEVFANQAFFFRTQYGVSINIPSPIKK